ncbi:MAG TPA: leucine--tRNA ligase [Actinomycetota bacterium]
MATAERDQAAAERYDPAAFEAAWAERWVAEGLFAAEDPRTSTKPKFYCLDMFPYPSGDLHMGHLEAFTGGDVVARYKWMRGHNVLHPIGWDAFGLPAENAAIKNGIHPRAWTYPNIEQQAASFKRLGMSFDWSRRFNTCDPDYYRWTQWLFLRFFEVGLAYRKAASTNWCPSCKTVLANEQVVGGRCERCGTLVTQREFVSWFFRESDYAQKLLDGMEQLKGWSEHALTIQRNWIGRSEGADVTFRVAETGEEVTVFTTRPDTLWGATFFVLAPEHPLARRLVAGKTRETMFEEFLDLVRRRSEIERAAVGKRKESFFTGAHAINPVTGKQIPIWCSDYVLMGYGTGAIMAVPAHDPRDFEFARQEGLEIRVVIQPEGQTLDPAVMTQAYDGEGVMVNSAHLDGTATPGGITRVVDWLEEQGIGTRRIRYRLRDWNVSRQRYWGCPIPIVHCPTDGEVPIPVEQLPVTLPDVEDYKPAETGESPLAKKTEWVNTTCPRCGGPAKRETDTLDTFIDSSWYFFRYCAQPDDAPLDPDLVNAWMPADHYTGGIEHATGHLIYSRFFTKVLHDLGLIGFDEPYPSLLNQGKVIMEGAKMSKSKGNLVAPSAIIEQYGADTARATMMFAGPFEADVDWADVSPQGLFRWLSRVWRFTVENASRMGAGEASGESALRQATHRAIQGVTEDHERFRFNTAIAKLMTLSNQIGENLGAPDEEVAEAIDALLRMLAPVCPFITEELWHRLGRDGSILKASWPAYDPALTKAETVTMVVQVSGKVRDRIEVPADIGEARMRELADASENVRKHIEGKEAVKVVVVPPKLVNIVVR